ncbi:MAG: DciA family protein [Nevskiales bacterium]
MSGRRLDEVLQERGASTQRLLNKASQLTRLQSRLRDWLPAPLREHVQLANLRDGRLILTADSNAWASKCRYLSPDLLQRLQAAGWPCQRIEVKVAPVYAPPRITKIKRSISDASRRLLLQTAAHIDEPGIANPLQKLARHK